MDLQQIKKQLPYGAMKGIAQKAGVSLWDVSRVFNGGKSSKELKIKEATAAYLTEYKAKEKQAEEAINKALER